MRLPDPIANTTTEAYLAYKAGVLAEGDLQPKLYEPYIHLDAWLAYWTGLVNTYPLDKNNDPEILTDEEAFIAYLSGVTNTYPQEFRDPADIRVAAYLRYLISARWGRPEYPVNNEEFYLSLTKTKYIPSGDPSSDIMIDGTTKAPFVDVKMYGDTFQQSYTGKNLFNYQAVVGLALGGTIVAGVAYRGYYIQSTAGETFTLSRATTTGNNRFRVCFTKNEPANGVTFYDEDGVPGQFINADNSTSVSVTVPQEMNYVFLYLSNTSETITESLHIQLETGSTATSYEPYVGRQPSPNPDYPQLIQTVTGLQTVEVSGKNLFDNTTTPVTESSGTSVSPLPNGLRVSYNTGSTTTSARFVCIVVGDASQFVGKNIVAQATMTPSASNAPRLGIGLCKADGSDRQTKAMIDASGSGYYTITSADVADRPYFYLYLYANLAGGTVKAGDYIDYTDLQVEIIDSTTPSDYEPYSSNAYEINLGKNLFDGIFELGNISPTTGANTSSNTTIRTKNYVAIKGGESYTISVVGGGNVALGFYQSNGTFIGVGTTKASPNTFTAPANAGRVRFIIANNTDISTKAQCEAGSQATAYAPYFTPIELCKIGTYQDYIWKDGDDWKIHKATTTKRFSGADSEGWVINNSGTENFYYRCPRAATGTYGTPDNSRYLYCNYESGAQVTTSNTTQGVFVLSGGDIRLRYGTEISLDDWEAKLAANNMVLTYALATPTDTVITNANLIAQLDSLVNGGAENGTTYIKVSATDPNLPGLLYVEAPKYD